jgi:tetratricopeptide (TPR) repeat protein
LLGCGDPVVERFEEGRAAQQGGRTEEAIHAFKEVAIGYPDHALAEPAWMEVAEIYYRDRRDVFLARQAAERVLKEFPNGRSQHRAEALLAQIFDQDLGDPARAVVYYERLLESGLSPERRKRVLFRMAECYYLLREFPLALQAYRQVIGGPDGGPVGIQARMRIARIQTLLDQPQAALASYRAALALNPAPALRQVALLSTADVLEELGEYGEALKILDQLGPQAAVEGARRQRLQEKLRNRSNPTVEWDRAGRPPAEGK